MDIIQNAFSGNTITYAVLGGVLLLFCTSDKHKPKSNNNESEKSNNNELQRLRTENEWRHDAISQGKSNSHDADLLPLHVIVT